MKFMFRRVAPWALALAMVLPLTQSCTERQRKNIKHIKSDIIGLKRRVTMYDCNGKVIRQWEGRFKVEEHGAFISFIDDNGNDVKVSGNIVIEEL